MAGIWDTKSKVPEKRAKELLKGAVDFHIHTGPDIYPRLVNDIEVAKQAKKAGMKAVLIKSHATITADRAQMAQFVTGFPVFGGVALNWQVGGLNKYAVECAAKLGAKQVWMPTTHAANYLKYVDHVPMFAKAMPKDMKGITILKEDGTPRCGDRPDPGSDCQKRNDPGDGAPIPNRRDRPDPRGEEGRR